MSSRTTPDLARDTVELGLADTQELQMMNQNPRLVMPPQNIILAGLQGAGKGTNSSRLKRREGIETYVSSDQMKLHPTYPQLKADMDKGVLIANERVMVIVREYMQVRTKISEALANGSREGALRLVFDGMPRTPGQKDDFDQMLEELGRDPAWAVKLHLDNDPKIADDIARASVRFRVRRDAANGKARADDTDTETVERRIKAFHSQTEPLLEQYGEQGRLLVVDAKPSFDYDTLDVEDDATFDRSADEIYARLVHALNNRNG